MHGEGGPNNQTIKEKSNSGARGWTAIPIKHHNENRVIKKPTTPEARSCDADLLDLPKEGFPAEWSLNNWTTAINLTMDAGPQNSEPPNKVRNSVSRGTKRTSDLSQMIQDGPATQGAKSAADQQTGKPTGRSTLHKIPKKDSTTRTSLKPPATN